MLKKILLGIGILTIIAVGVFLAYVTTRPGTFHYERSGVINASAEQIYPYLNNFKLGGQWSPFERVDPNMKKTYSGPDAGIGAKMAFDGNSDAGAGNLEILNEIPDSFVEIRLVMTKPIHASNIVQYKLTPEENGTRFTWSMSGENGFLGKLVGIFIDCDKMIGDQFSRGIENLQTVVAAERG